MILGVGGSPPEKINIILKKAPVILLLEFWWHENLLLQIKVKDVKLMLEIFLQANNGKVEVKDVSLLYYKDIEFEGG